MRFMLFVPIMLLAACDQYPTAPAVSSAEPSQIGRYQIFDTTGGGVGSIYLLDTQTGTAWRGAIVRQKDGLPTAWVPTYNTSRSEDFAALSALPDAK